MMQPQYQQYQQQYQQQQKVNSGTNTMFQSMVGGTDCTLPSFCNKKQKLISNILDIKDQLQPRKITRIIKTKVNMLLN